MLTVAGVAVTPAGTPVGFQLVPSVQEVLSVPLRPVQVLLVAACTRVVIPAATATTAVVRIRRRNCFAPPFVPRLQWVGPLNPESVFRTIHAPRAAIDHD